MSLLNYTTIVLVFSGAFHGLGPAEQGGGSLWNTLMIPRYPFVAGFTFPNRVCYRRQKKSRNLVKWRSFDLDKTSPGALTATTAEKVAAGPVRLTRVTGQSARSAIAIELAESLGR